jgi:diketogulonate reductase-like aldo/keto reductase
MFGKTLALLSLLALSEAQGKYGVGPQKPVGGGPIEKVPAVGLGTWAITDPVAGKEAVARAMEVGFRHFDTAMIYQNEEIVGAGLAEGMRRTGIKREDFWVTTKLWNDR